VHCFRGEESECRRGIKGEIDQRVDRQADRMIDRGWGVAETEGELRVWGPVQHFESDCHVIDY